MNQFQFPDQRGLSQTAAQGVTVRRVERAEYWITLPGDIASHKLTEQQAKQLLRQLEEVV